VIEDFLGGLLRECDELGQAWRRRHPPGLDRVLARLSGWALLGRAFTGAAVPRDGGPQVPEGPTGAIPVGGPSVNPARRIIPRTMVRTGIPMIDIFNTLVESQKIPIFSTAGEPYNQLLARIALQAEVDVIVLGGMGLRHDDYLYFREALAARDALGRATMPAWRACAEPPRRRAWRA